MTTPASRIFNGSVFNFSSSPVAGIVGISYKEGGNWIDVTMPADLNKLWQISTQPDFAVSLKFKGGSAAALTYAATGAASITWSDGTTTSCPGTWTVGPMEVQGDWDAPITSTRELRPTIASS